jgi:hypothetical protein
MERAHDGGEEVEGRKHDKLHGWGVRGVSSERERRGGNGAVKSIYAKLK